MTKIEELTSVELDRFWTKVAVREDVQCWPWQRSTNAAGYGNIRIRNRGYLAHRISYLIAHGSLPDDRVVRHSCDNPPCCNPAHLLLGTHADNVRDRIERGRSNQAYGTRIATATLNESLVLTIRQLGASGQVSERGIARHLSVGRGAVRGVLAGRTWTHVEEMSWPRSEN